jgi:hypothetical protein
LGGEKMDQSIIQIAQKFDSKVEKRVYDPMVKYLQNQFTTLKFEEERRLLLAFTMFFDSGHPVIGFSGSKADIVGYFPQKQMRIDKKDMLLRRAGQYKFGKNEIIYPCVIIQINTSTKTGKLHQENMKAQKWRELFPRALLVLLAGHYGDKFDIRFDRDTSAFDEVISELRNPDRCQVGLKRLCEGIKTHIDTKWSGSDGFFSAI